MRRLGILSFLKHSIVGLWIVTLAPALSTTRGLTFRPFLSEGFYELVIFIVFLSQQNTELQMLFVLWQVHHT